MRTLVVEDQPDLRRLLRGFLEDEGFAVDSAADGNEGLAKVLTYPYDSLLEYLLLHRGRLMRREELLDHLSDECDESNSNVLDVYVSNIRKKLGADLVQTRRGLGYVIAE